MATATDGPASAHLAQSAGGLPSAVQHFLATDGRYADDLAENPDLAPEVWDALWGTRPKSATRAIALVSRALTAPQRHTVLTTDTRPRVIRSLANYNELDRDEILLLLRRGTAVPHHLSQEILDRFSADDEVLEALLPVVYPMLQLDVLAFASPAVLSDAALVAHLDRLGGEHFDPRYANRTSGLTRIIETRPHLFDRLVRRPRTAAMTAALAASQHLVDPEHQALLAGLDPVTLAPMDTEHFVRGLPVSELCANPRTRIEIVVALDRAIPRGFNYDALRYRLLDQTPAITGDYAELDDPAQIDRVFTRATRNPASTGGLYGHPYDLLHLARNPHLAARQAGDLPFVLAQYSVVHYLGAVEVTEAHQVLYANFPGVEHAPLRTALPRARTRKRVRIGGHFCADEVLAMPMGEALRHRFWAMGPCLATILGDEVPAWEMFVGLLDSTQMDASVARVATVASHLSRRALTAA